MPSQTLEMRPGFSALAVTEQRVRSRLSESLFPEKPAASLPVPSSRFPTMSEATYGDMTPPPGPRVQDIYEANQIAASMTEYLKVGVFPVKTDGAFTFLREDHLRELAGNVDEKDLKKRSEETGIPMSILRTAENISTAIAKPVVVVDNPGIGYTFMAQGYEENTGNQLEVADVPIYESQEATSAAHSPQADQPETDKDMLQVKMAPSIKKGQNGTERNGQKMKPNRLEQTKNLSKFTGVYKGVFYIDGVAQPAKKKEVAPVSKNSSGGFRRRKTN